MPHRFMQPNVASGQRSLGLGLVWGCYSRTIYGCAYAPKGKRGRAAGRDATWVDEARTQGGNAS